MFGRASFLFFAAFVAATPVQALPLSALQTDGREIPTIAPLIADIDDAVVNIAVTSEKSIQTTPLFEDPFFRRFLPPNQQLPPQRQLSSGSGVIVDAEMGYILTNHHVIEDGKQIKVVLRDKRQFDAEVIGSDPATDIALLQIDAKDLSAIEFGNSEDLLVGDFVVAIGNPFGLGQTVTSGIVSALGRAGINPDGYEDFIQTDASINPGNSGGALVTLDGKLVGINTAIISPNGGGNVGVGFAVPINMAQAVMDQLIRFGEVQRGRLGVMIQDLTPDLAEALGAKAERGAVVSSVDEGTAAERAGIAPGDIVVDVNGIEVEGSSDLRHLIGMQRPGDEVEILLLRNGEEIELQVALGGKSETETIEASLEDSDTLAGVELGRLERGLPGYGEVEGIAVINVAPSSSAARAGLQPGDVITSINRKTVDSIRDVKDVLAESPRAVALSIWRDGRNMFLALVG